MNRISFILCLLLLTSFQAQAHKVLAMAYADGMTIEGEVGFSNGEMALPGSLIEVFDAAGNKLSEVNTTEGGLFSFQANSAIDHHFRADLGAGHIAEFIVPADELSGGETAAQTNVTPAAAVSSSVSSVDAELVRKEIAAQIKPLRKEIMQLRERSGLQDIIGGIGYIFGLFGLWALWKSRREATS